MDVVVVDIGVNASRVSTVDTLGLSLEEKTQEDEKNGNQQ